MNDQPRGPGVAGLGEVDHVPCPARSDLGAEAGLGVVGALDAVAGASALDVAQPHVARSSVAALRRAVPRPRRIPLEVARPDAAHHTDHGQVAELGGGTCIVQGVEQAEAVAAHLKGVGLALGLGAGHPHVLDAPVAAFVPLGRRDGAQPPGGDTGDGVERRAQRLGHELQAAEEPDGGEHVRAVRAAATAGPQEPFLAGGVQQPVEQAPGGGVLKEPSPELAQHREVEAGVVGIEREQVLPVDPAARGIGRLPVAEPLAELHQRDQRQAPRRVGRLTAPRVEGGEVGVSEHRTEPVAQDHVRVAAPERGPGDALRDGRQRLRAERHGRPPGGTTTLHQITGRPDRLR